MSSGVKCEEADSFSYVPEAREALRIFLKKRGKSTE
jgi:hypothetical protein